MRNVAGAWLGLSAVAVLLLSAAMLSAEPVGAGKVIGKVRKGEDPVASVKVVLAKPPVKGAAPTPDGKKPKPEVVAETQTDADGAFTFADVPAGHYMVIAGDKTVGMGRTKVTVKAGETVSVNIEVKVRSENPDNPKR